MRIEGTYGSDYLNRMKADKPAGEKKSSGAKGSEKASANMPLKSSQPASVEEVDRTAIAEAIRALESGELDSRDAARKTAESILDLGL